jgi:type I restriction enzyme S subunit
MRNGRSDRPSTGGEAGTRTLTLTAVTKNAFTEANTKVTVTAPDRARDLWLEPGDVFVQRSNTPELVGTTARYKGPREWAIFPDLLIRLRADEEKIDSRFLAAALQSKPGHDQLRRKAKGLAGSMPKIDQTAIADTTIPLPPVDVQRQMLATIEDAAAALTLLRAALSSAQRRSGGLRRSLLAAAFSGRLTGYSSDLDLAKELASA